MRVVLDTSILVAGLRSRLGASNRLLALVAEARESGIDPEQALRDAVRRVSS